MVSEPIWYFLVVDQFKVIWAAFLVDYQIKSNCFFAENSTIYSSSMEEEMEETHIMLTPFNLFDWKVEMVLQLRAKRLYRVTMGTEVEPNSVVKKAKYFNWLYEAFGLLCLTTLREILLHINSLTTPNEVWVKLETLFGKTDELHGHQP